MTFLGWSNSTEVGGKDYTEVNFKLDIDWACEIFQSCKQESFIAMAGVSSSIAFLDFMGVNGQNSSLSIITFEQTTGEEFPSTLMGEGYPCDYAVPEDGVLGNYTGILNSTCSYC